MAATAVGTARELEGGERAERLAALPVAATRSSRLRRLADLRPVALEVETYYLVTRFQNVVELHMARRERRRAPPAPLVVPFAAIGADERPRVGDKAPALARRRAAASTCRRASP